MTILVTGATGNVGSELVPQLVQAGQQVRVLSRDPRKVEGLDPRIERVIGDFDRPETLAKALDGVEKVFLVTAETHQDVNVLEAAGRSGVRHVVRLSTTEVYKPDLLPIGRWNLERDTLLQTSGLSWTILRPGQFMSNALQWAGAVRKLGMVIFPGGKGRSAPVDPYDIARVATLGLTRSGHEGKIYDLTGPALVTTAQQVKILGDVLGKPLRHINPPLFLVGIAMRRAGMKPEEVRALLILARMAMRGQMERQTDTAQQLTGVPPNTFETWCRHHIAVFRSDGQG